MRVDELQEYDRQRDARLGKYMVVVILSFVALGVAIWMALQPPDMELQRQEDSLRQSAAVSAFNPK